MGADGALPHLTRTTHNLLMIRRDTGPDYHLITQHDHALLAAELAKHFGNKGFGRPVRGEVTITAVAQHDSGWPLHDNAPTLNKQNQPLDVFEVSRDIALPVWTESANLSERIHPYAGLLVSLHVLSLSVYATSQAPTKHEKFDLADMRERFEINKFQHREIERQEHLRKQLGLRIDLPLTHGIAEAGADSKDDELTFDFRMLQAMDQISLALCCTIPPMQQTTQVLPHAGEAPIHIQVRRDAEYRVRVSPWPFDVSEIEVKVPARRVQGGTYATNDELRQVYNSAPLEHLTMIVAPDD